MERGKRRDGLTPPTTYDFQCDGSCEDVYLSDDTNERKYLCPCRTRVCSDPLFGVCGASRDPCRSRDRWLPSSGSTEGALPRPRGLCAGAVSTSRTDPVVRRTKRVTKRLPAAGSWSRVQT